MIARVSAASAALLVVALTGCAPKPVPVVDVQGSCGTAYTGKVCTWARTQGANLVEIGADVPMASIENAPAMEPMAWPPVAVAKIDLPESAKAQSGMTQLTMYWEPMGHPPGPYMTPHFDFHFNNLPAADITAIDCKDSSKPAALPTAYGLPDVPLPPDMAKIVGVPVMLGLCVPGMGMHSLLASELEGKTPFSGTMVVGYYKTKPIFIEPMLTKAMLMEKKSFDLPIPSVPGLGAHATKFHAEFDAAKQQYRFTFSGFAAATS